jgi:5-methylcytosine-specific restriction endonuclease McrA
MKEPNKKCLMCGKPFYTPPCLERVKYCSQYCCKKSRRGKKLPKEWKERISKGVKNNLPRTAWKKGQHFNPATEFKKGENLEENHPNWTGGTYAYIRIFERSGKEKICEKCGESEKRILIHHKDGDRKNNKLENLIALCDTCHGKEHRSFNRIKICEWCKKEFETHENKKRFCSISCGLKNRWNK